MYLLLLAVASAVSACIPSDDSLLCDSFSALANMSDAGGASTVYISDCDSLDLTVLRPHTSIMHVHVACDISEDTLSGLSLRGVDRVSIHLDNCSATTLPWQSMLAASSDVVVDASACPLSCSCRNEWLVGTWPGYALPDVTTHNLTHCSFNHCERPRLRVSEVGEMVVGGRLEVAVDVEPPQELVDTEKIDRRYFVWRRRGDARHSEWVEAGGVRLRVENVSAADLGEVLVRCWHCRLPVFDRFQVRLPVALSLHLTEEHDSEILAVHGWPLTGITLRIEKLSSGESEERSIANRTVAFFNASLLVKPNVEHSLFHLRYWSVFSRSCQTCPENHPHGNYTFRVCSDSAGCDSVYNYIDHFQTPNKRSPSARRSLSYFPLLLVVGVAMTTAFLVVVARKARAIEWLARHKSLRRRPPSLPAAVSRSRRTSRATEETDLRMEERSLSSYAVDYSGIVVPVIQLGNIQLHEKIGAGAFGEVYCGSWERLGARSVAVKTMKDSEGVLEKEAVLLCRLDHSNVVRLFGMSRDDTRLLLVFEMMSLGDLRSYLRARTPPSQQTSYAQFPAPLENRELLHIVREILRGLCYLHTQQIVHRDLAARNCLVDGKSDMTCCHADKRPPITVKISDFGMSRRLYAHSEYYRLQSRNSMLPIRWLPPEALHTGKFNHQTDIWAFGVTMWEVFSYGDTPFSDLSNHELISLGALMSLPQRPERCSEEIYSVMLRCWEREPERRISAEDALLDPAVQEKQPPQPLIDPSLS